MFERKYRQNFKPFQLPTVFVFIHYYNFRRNLMPKSRILRFFNVYMFSLFNMRRRLVDELLRQTL